MLQMLEVDGAGLAARPIDSLQNCVVFHLVNEFFYVPP